MCTPAFSSVITQAVSGATQDEGVQPPGQKRRRKAMPLLPESSQKQGGGLFGNMISPGIRRMFG